MTCFVGDVVFIRGGLFDEPPTPPVGQSTLLDADAAAVLDADATLVTDAT